MNIDDVACVTALAAAIVSIGVGAASVIGHSQKMRHGTPVAQECPRSHPAATTELAPRTFRAL